MGDPWHPGGDQRRLATPVATASDRDRRHPTDQPLIETGPAALAERTLLVTGASRGIGRAISEQLLQAGARVVGIWRDFSAWSTRPAGLQTVELDLGHLDRLPQALKEICTAHPEIDGLVCNAGTGRFGSLEEFSPAQIRDLI